MLEKIYLNIMWQHDYRLLLFALVICLISSSAAVSLQYRARNSQEHERDSWIFLSAGAIGLGGWVTQFISVLAYDIGTPVSYSFIYIVAALALAILAAVFSYRIATYNRTKRVRSVAGLVMGTGFTGCHFFLLQAINIQGSVSVSLDYAVLSTVVGVGLAVASLVAMNKTQDVVRYCTAAGLLTASACSVHFLAAAGLTVKIDPLAVIPENVFSEAYLVVGMSFLTLFYLGFSLSRVFAREKGDGPLLETVRLRSLADAALEGIIVMDAGGHIVNANHSFLKLTGKKIQKLRGTHIKKYFPCFADEHNISSLAEKASHFEDATLLIGDQTEIPAELFFRQAQVDGETLQVLVVRDLREQKAAEQQIKYLSNYDQLTGLANRQVMMGHLSNAVAVARREQNKVAVLYVDIDDFKGINALSGQQSGDEILSIMATRLKSCVAEKDIVARIGADQFCIIQEQLEKVEEAGVLVDKVCDAIDTPFVLGDKKVSATISVGIAATPTDTEDPRDLLGYAEVAMKHAKSTAGNSYRFYEEALDRTLLLRRQLKNDLVGALRRNEISVVYQPQFGALKNEVVGFEALVRWQHPQRGAISPAESIPLAEESGFILELGKWILEEACREAATWKKHINIAVNMSPVQFRQGGLPEIVADALRNNSLAPERLEIEITEGVLIDDVDHALRVLTKLKESGTKLAMDDFGTGYSSLSYLQRFPFDKLKIDQSFIASLHESEQSLGIVRGMIGLAHGLNVPIIAEGVETEVQFSMLKVEGCDEIQ
ncbi:MAG: EAL domain-containing protein, partial [Kordiimonadaceae bacterium]|nr:EAL domain-containing protein [Kordiimonadaceae bacterium]